MPWSLRMVLYASIILCLILAWFGYRYFRSVHRAKLHRVWIYKTLFLLCGGLFLAYPAAGVMEYWSTGSFTRTGYPNAIIYLFWYGLVYMGVMLNWLILHDLLLPFANLVSSKTKTQTKRWFAKGFLLIAAVGMAYTGLKMVWDTSRIITEEIRYTLPDADGSFEPLTIVHIADLHADEYTREAKMERYVQMVNSFRPDVVVFAGDLITSGTDYIDAGAAALGKIEATYGIYAVPGDHDYWTETGRVINALEGNGIIFLENKNAWIDHHGSQIRITGITELYSSRVPSDSLSALLHESRNERLRILTSHQATSRLIEQSKETGVHQLFGGHTHGGQIRIPFFFFYLTAARAETPYVNGNWLFDDMLLNINNGLGFTLAPVRYNAPAQVSVIRVTAGDSKRPF